MLLDAGTVSQSVRLCAILKRHATLRMDSQGFGAQMRSGTVVLTVTPFLLTDPISVRAPASLASQLCTMSGRRG